MIENRVLKFHITLFTSLYTRIYIFTLHVLVLDTRRYFFLFFFNLFLLLCLQLPEGSKAAMAMKVGDFYFYYYFLPDCILLI